MASGSRAVRLGQRTSASRRKAAGVSSAGRCDPMPILGSHAGKNRGDQNLVCAVVFGCKQIGFRKEKCARKETDNRLHTT